MKNIALIALAGTLAGILASCGGGTPPAAQVTESVVFDNQQYSMNGQPISADALRAVEAQQGRLFLLATPAASGTVLAVYTSMADLEAAKGQQLAAQGICVGRSRTTVWEQVGYAGSSLEIAKGQSFGDLSTLFQPDGEDWDNDIEAYKAACSAYSYFYTSKNFGGSVLVARGDVLSDMGGWNNIVSSIQVTN